MTVRPATADDVEPLARLEHDIFGADAWSAAAVAEEVAGADRLVEVAVVADEVVGYAVTRLGGEVADLQRVAVSPAHRRQGFAGWLMRSAAGAAAAARADRMLLEVSAANAGALALYAAHGFVEIDRRRRYYRDGTDAVILRLALGPACGGTE